MAAALGDDAECGSRGDLARLRSWTIRSWTIRESNPRLGQGMEVERRLEEFAGEAATRREQRGTS